MESLEKTVHYIEYLDFLAGHFDTPYNWLLGDKGGELRPQVELLNSCNSVLFIIHCPASDHDRYSLARTQLLM